MDSSQFSPLSPGNEHGFFNARYLIMINTVNNYINYTRYTKIVKTYWPFNLCKIKKFSIIIFRFVLIGWRLPVHGIPSQHDIVQAEFISSFFRKAVSTSYIKEGKNSIKPR